MLINLDTIVYFYKCFFIFLTAYFTYFYVHTFKKGFLIFTTISALHVLSIFNLVNYLVIYYLMALVFLIGWIIDKRLTWLFLTFPQLIIILDTVSPFFDSYSPFFRYIVSAIKGVILYYLYITLVRAVYQDPLLAKKLNTRHNKFYRMTDEKKINYLTKLLDKHPVTENYISRGNVYHTIGEVEKAQADYLKAIETSPEHASGYIYLGILHIEQHAYTTALTYINKAVSLTEDENKAAILYQRAICHYHLGHYREALKDISETQQTYIGDAHIFLLRARTFLAMGYPDQALIDAEKAIEKSQGDSNENDTDTKEEALTLLADIRAKQAETTP
ncbi:tetratricopeptide repeat protein [Salipaludibacillus agaradhaerens]|uniref:tetratricopeptide repeat protein n=1 Tax=Salipaludibacillus agaradhaerens TaxID=76935 RepID=UPI000998AC6F|nr:CDC27 family protein [Salipaludibacillus agaradhaerens]